MNDDRLDNLEVAETSESYGSPIRIDRIKLTNYKFFHGEFELEVKGRNLLVYGENGSGKSSVYRALELLTKDRIKNLGADGNVFSDDGEVEVEFGFSDGTVFTITEDIDKIPDDMLFVKGLSVFSPMLDYKKLLKVHYTEKPVDGKINLHGMLRKLLKKYPIESGGTLTGIKDFSKYFKELEEIVNNELLIEINRYIEEYFGLDFRIASFEFRQEIIDEERGTPEPIVTMNVDFREQPIEEYHKFLNEARLSALAISLYFVSIKKLLGILTEDSLKILVLDDLLISLDMSNRLKLLSLIKEEFKDFQIFFFTHDKELFDIYRGKMDWKKYELYMDDNEDIPRCIVKEGKSEFERAKKFYAEREFESCALMLRKDFEILLKSYLTPREQLNRNCEELDLAGMISRAISKSSGEAEKILEKLNTDRKHILNPLCHFNGTSVFSDELKKAMEDMEKLKTILR